MNPDTDKAANIARALETIHASEPERDHAMTICIEAWHDLGTCRAIGMAMGSIPWTAIDRWAERHDLDGENTKTLSYVIRHLDCERAHREASKQRHANATGNGGG